MSTRCTWFTVAATTLLWSAPAGAHVGSLIDAIDVAYRTPDGDEVHVEASFGLLLQRDGVWDWVCHEAVTTPEATLSPRYARSTTGEWLAWIVDLEQGRDGQGLFFSADGCVWEHTVGLEDRLVVWAEHDPSDPGTALAVTADDGDNGVYRSTDGGRTWTPTDAARAGATFDSVAFAGETGTAWATATSDDQTAAWIYRSDDGGQSWEAFDVDLPAGVAPPMRLRVLAASVADASTAWFVVDPFGDDFVLRTEDGGESAPLVLFGEGEAVDAATDPSGTLWLIMSGDTLLRSDDGLAYEPVEAFTSGIGVTARAGELLVTAHPYAVGHAYEVSQDGGAAFSPLLPVDDITGVKDCPAGTDVAMACDPLWEVLAKSLETGSGPLDTAYEPPDIQPHPKDPEPEDDDGSGCGCTTGGLASVPLWFALLVATGRRR